MQHKQITIKDIARKLGISPSTVSRALKDHPNISERTRKEVKELAKELKYKPNQVALSLLNSKTNVIGVIIPEIVHHFFSTVISGIEHAAHKGGYKVMICQSNELYEHEVMNVEALMSSRVDGMLVSLSKRSVDLKHLEGVVEDGTPLVFFDRFPETMETDRVVVDDFEGAYKVVKHMIDSGCKRIAHLGTSPTLTIGKNRREGYMEALRKNGIQVDESLILHCDDYEPAIEMTRELLKLPEPPDGIFAVNDWTAIGAMKAVKLEGFRVPEDIAIAGFTNSIISLVTEPSLTTVEQNGFEMGKSAAEILLRRIEGKEEFDYQTHIISTRVVLRDSTKHTV